MSKKYVRPSRFEKYAEPSAYGQDIKIGQAIVKAEERYGVSGWDLPGGRFITCPFKAKNAAIEMNRLIIANGGIPALKNKVAA